MTSATSPLGPRGLRRRAAIAAAALLLAAVAGGYAIYGRPATPLPRPEAGDVLLFATFPLEGSGVSLRLRVRAPSTLEISVDPAEGARVRVSFGVPAPVEASPVDVPVAETAASWTAAPGDTVHREVVLAPGLYVLRLEPAATSTRGAVAVRVRVLPPR